jgi:hypothetical protein
MKFSALAFPLSFLLMLGPARGQQSEPAGADYISYAEKLIERTRQEKPDIANRADELYKRLPAIVDQLEEEAKAAGSAAAHPGIGTGAPQIEAEMERWISEKGANIDTEIRFAAGRLKTVREAMQPVMALMAERQRKQQIISSVIILIKDFLAGEDGAPDDSDVDRNKADREPSASNGTRNGPFSFVTPTKVGSSLKRLKVKLDSGFRRNDENNPHSVHRLSSG